MFTYYYYYYCYCYCYYYCYYYYYWSRVCGFGFKARGMKDLGFRVRIWGSDCL